MQHPLVTQASWQRTMLAPSYNWPIDAGSAAQQEALLPLMIAEHLLGGSKTSRLYRALVEEKELATSVSVSYNPFRLGPGEFSIYVTPKQIENMPVIEKIIEQEIVTLTATPPTSAELSRAKTQMIASNVYLRDGLQPLAKVMGHLAMINLPLDYYTDWPEQVKAVTAEQVSASLKQLSATAMVTGELLPAAK